MRRRLDKAITLIFLAIVLEVFVAAASASSITSPGSIPRRTTGELINTWIDSLLATGARILELPLFMLLGAVGIAGALFALFIMRVSKSADRRKLFRRLLFVEAALL